MKGKGRTLWETEESIQIYIHLIHFITDRQSGTFCENILIIRVRLFFWIFFTISTRISKIIWLLSEGYMNNFKHFTCVQLQFFQGLKIITQHCSLYGKNSILRPFIWNSYSFRVITFWVITFCVRRFITFCVKKLLHFASTLLLHFSSILLHFALILQFAANVITFCGDYYILRRNNIHWKGHLWKWTPGRWKFSVKWFQRSSNNTDNTY